MGVFLIEITLCFENIRVSIYPNHYTGVVSLDVPNILVTHCHHFHSEDEFTRYTLLSRENVDYGGPGGKREIPDIFSHVTSMSIEDLDC